MALGRRLEVLHSGHTIYPTFTKKGRIVQFTLGGCIRLPASYWTSISHPDLTRPAPTPPRQGAQ